MISATKNQTAQWVQQQLEEECKKNNELLAKLHSKERELLEEKKAYIDTYAHYENAIEALEASKRREWNPQKDPDMVFDQEMGWVHVNAQKYVDGLKLKIRELELFIFKAEL